MAKLILRFPIKPNGSRAHSSLAILRVMIEINGMRLYRTKLFGNPRKFIKRLELANISDLYLFDPIFYQQKYDDISGSNADALRHFVNHGQYEFRDPCPLFDSQYYMTCVRSHDEYSETNFNEIPPYLHFLTIGWKRGLNPSPFFNLDWYVSQNSDVSKVKINPLFHFLKYGIEEGRPPHPNVDLRWYSRRYSSFTGSKSELLTHLVLNSKMKATSAKDDQRRFGYRVTLSDARKPYRNKAEIMQQAKADTPVPAIDVSSEIFPFIGDAAFLTVDIWDTILRRDCHPDEIKLQVSRSLCVKFKLDILPHLRDPNALLRCRFEAEREVATADWEYRLEDVVTRWLQISLKNGLSQTRHLEIYTAAIQFELSAERRSTRVDELAKSALIEYKRPIYFISDFYTDSNFIRNVLKSHNIDNLLMNGFVSSETYKNKRSGELYKVVEDALEIESTSHWVHVGDNIQADITSARKAGIDARLYKNKIEIDRTNWFKVAYDDGAAGNNLTHEARIYSILENAAQKLVSQGRFKEAVGARLAPIAIGFALSVIEDAISEGASDVFFFTREGVFFRKIANQIIQEDPYSSAYPNLEILEVSRRSTYGPSLSQNFTGDLMRMWSLYSSQSLRSFSVSLNLDLKLMEGVCGDLQVQFDKKIQYPWLDSDFMAVVMDSRVQSIITETIEYQRVVFFRYLKSKNFDASHDRAPIVVDIGWRGTIQDNIAHITGRPIRGHYLGLNKFLNEQPKNSVKFGWLYDENGDPTSALAADVAPLEMLFNSQGGSVLKYLDETDSVIVSRLIVKNEEAVIKEYIEPIQAGMLHVVGLVIEYIRLHGLTSSSLKEFSRSLLLDLSNNPPSEVADAFLALEHNETFGTGDVDIIGGHDFLDEILDHTTSAEVHLRISDAAKNHRWPQALYNSEAVVRWWERQSTQQVISCPTALTYARLGGSTCTGQLRVGVFAPAPIAGSGGHRTIFAVVRAIRRLGCEVHCFVEQEGEGLELVEEWLEDSSVVIHSQWHKHINLDYALATVAHSASFVAELSNARHKGYLVQDFEAYFNPMSDGYVKAENSYSFGLTHFTIGRWLSHLIPSMTGGVAISSGLGVDHNIYRCLTDTKRERAICFLYQPEKPRRLAETALDALSLIKRLDPSVRIYAYGSNVALNSMHGIENLGLIFDQNKINELYNKCSVGLCLSLTNPSRIPFEMMAAGCIPIDLYRYNNLFDYADGTAVLAYQDAPSIADAILHVLELDAEQAATRRAQSVKAMRSRTLSWESDVIANAIVLQMTGSRVQGTAPTMSYFDEPFISRFDDRSEVRNYCRHQRKLAQ
ncbi:hypothetical protein HCU64_02815 [Methylobacterium sp. C25]|uniref:rhamnosyltransferase WsaF family glycosyltransferase n=1 Tax=Methylobacterium sp. C25 TaxID=2721622 RepID=UPI001F3411D3|nr:hypothetical protein [Methylobacterium sp. C25]MCE4222672.1 hypothetical protein [Methylobacterium sp. C25]